MSTKKSKNPKPEKKSRLKSYIESKFSDSTRTEKLLYKETLFGTDSSTVVRTRFSSTFLTPFALALGAPSTFIGLLSSMPLLMGSIFQLFVADIMKIVKTRKNIIVFTSFIEALLWIPLLLIPFFWGNNYVLLLNIVVLQGISLSILRPFYSSLLGDVIPSHKKGKILGTMNFITGSVGFITIIFFGFILNLFEKTNPFIGFAIIFFINCVSMIIASLLRTRYRDTTFNVDSKMQSLFNFSKNLKKTNFGKFVLYSSLTQFSLAIASPFFAQYMLEYLHWDMLTYTLVSSVSIISSILVIKKWGNKIDQKGSMWMLGISAFIIPFMPILWIFFRSPLLLIVVQFISGAAWAAYNLSTSSFIMDATTDKTRVILNSYYFFFRGVFIFIGAMLGGFLLQYLPTGFFGSSYFFVFGLSAVLRLAFALYFIPNLKDERFLNIKVKGSKEDLIIIPNRGFVEFDPKKRR